MIEIGGATKLLQAVAERSVALRVETADLILVEARVLAARMRVDAGHVLQGLHHGLHVARVELLARND